MRRGLYLSFVGVITLTGLGVAWKAPGSWKSSQPPTSTGRFIDPVGDGAPVGSFPTNLALSPNGKWLAVTCTGSRSGVSILDSNSGKVVSQKSYPEGLYYGIAFGSNSELFVSQGAEDKIDRLSISDTGELGAAISLSIPGKVERLSANPAGLALSDDGATVILANNESGRPTDYAGGLVAVDTKSGNILAKSRTAGFPFGLVQKGGTAYTSSERDNAVVAFDASSLAQKAMIPVGENPTGLLLNENGRTLFVANSSSDSISVIDTRTNEVARTILVRPAEVRGLPGCTPLGLALSSDGKTLYAACADLNAVAVIDVDAGSVKGYLPTGWYPTSVQVTADGKKLFVSSGKGTHTRNPNGKPVGKWGQYILGIMEGAVTMIDLPEATRDLPSLTQVALKDALIGEDRESKVSKSFKNPGIKHVVYVIKENRTYDQILGDLKGANGDASLAIYGQDVTPNTHALAQRFGVFDNFFVCAEVSADGWNWSTGGMTSEYTNRNTIYNYTHGKRSYDFEGETNDSPVEILGKRDVATPPGGYIWDLCAKGGLSYQTYGSFVAFGPSAEKGPDGKPLVGDNEPVKTNLVGHSDTNFRQFDMRYPDSDVLSVLGFPPTPRQRKSFGKFGAKSRFEEWKRTFDGYVEKGDFPAFSLVRFCRDHTSGSAAGLSSPRAMVADNDFAIGQLVEAISHSPYWKDTVICILEDDAQNGYDHVDAHRSPALIISAYNKPNSVDHRFYNTDSMLRTMELCLGLPPMNQFDALATPFSPFSNKLVNASPYKALVPSKQIAGEFNLSSAYRSRESEVYLAKADENSANDVRLNEILWRIAKGANAKLPNTPGAAVLR